ncbi:MAG TPA: YkvA family protein [Candidatus Eremiobacteraceae bacterium]|jgi:uncharacterized membrane protein YkvA (DUF1232 family)|nr:YkvA family protein [Candidatus Eremiobacteraceae bacterium]
MSAMWLRVKTFWALRRNAVRVARLFLDKRVPGALKVMTALGALFVISPLDPLSDIPVLGVVDDALLLMLVAWLFVRFSPPEVVAEYSAEAAESRIKNVTPS